jgi:hypothetical protein
VRPGWEHFIHEVLVRDFVNSDDLWSREVCRGDAPTTARPLAAADEQRAGMSKRVPPELFSGGAVVAARLPPSRPTESQLKAKLEAARFRLHEIVMLGMKTWLGGAFAVESSLSMLRWESDWFATSPSG